MIVPAPGDAKSNLSTTTTCHLIPVAVCCMPKPDDYGYGYDGYGEEEGEEYGSGDEGYHSGPEGEFLVAGLRCAWEQGMCGRAHSTACLLLPVTFCLILRPH